MSRAEMATNRSSRAVVWLTLVIITLFVYCAGQTAVSVVERCQATQADTLAVTQ